MDYRAVPVVEVIGWISVEIYIMRPLQRILELVERQKISFVGHKYQLMTLLQKENFMEKSIFSFSYKNSMIYQRGDSMELISIIQGMGTIFL